MNTKGKVKLTGIAIIPAVVLLLVALVFSAPSPSGTSWKDNFSDSTGISTISNLNLYK